jgi:hypothetical protein
MTGDGKKNIHPKSSRSSLLAQAFKFLVLSDERRFLLLL